MAGVRIDAVEFYGYDEFEGHRTIVIKEITPEMDALLHQVLALNDERLRAAVLAASPDLGGLL